MRKNYHICQSVAGALGGQSRLSRMPQQFTCKEAAERQCKELASEAPLGTIYFVEWEWDKR